jgi:hypothetical protein
MILVHVSVKPFTSMHANVVEFVSLVSLLILSIFNVASSAHVTGGSDDRNHIVTILSVSLMILTLMVGVIAWLHDRCQKYRSKSIPSLLSPAPQAHSFLSQKNNENTPFSTIRSPPPQPPPVINTDSKRS